jgi:hypothetical protein
MVKVSVCLITWYHAPDILSFFSGLPITQTSRINKFSRSQTYTQPLQGHTVRLPLLYRV